MSYDDCLEDNREDYCGTVMCCIVPNHMSNYEPVSLGLVILCVQFCMFLSNQGQFVLWDYFCVFYVLSGCQKQCSAWKE